MSEFYKQVDRFNSMYKLEMPTKLTLLDAGLIRSFFKVTLQDELDESTLLLKNYAKAETNDERLDVMVEVADLLADIVVYCNTFARRMGIPMEGVLDIIMKSNFTKLGADGKPIYDEHGKVLKGLDYKKPEPEIKAFLLETLKGEAV